jgi:inner membrane protein YidH
MTSTDERQPTSDGEHSVASEVVNDFRVRAAFVRTAMSSEQSLMSWIRTSVSLYTFGFAIAQFFYYMAGQQESAQLSAGPRILGLALVATGLLAILLGTIEHVLRIRSLREAGLPTNVRFLLPLGSAAAFLLIGIAVLVAISLNWHF